MSFTVAGERYFVLADDAMISMRHAYFLAHGQGLVWNPGQRVEGITNLGWTLVMAAVHLLPLPLRLTSLVLQILNLALHLCLMAYIYRFLRARAGEKAALGGALLVGLNAPLLAYGLMGFETSLQTLLITLALLRFIPGPASSTQTTSDAQTVPLPTAGLRWVPLLCALAFVVRPDAIVLFLTGSGAALYVTRRDRREQRAVLWAIAAGICLMASVLAFQKEYYGYWFPNTYYLKASGDTRQLGRGLKYVMKFAVQEFQIAFLLAPLLYLIGGLRTRQTWPAFMPVLAVLGAWVAYIVWVGGDVFYLSRFWTPIIPMLAVCTVLFLSREWTQAGHKVAALAVLLLLAVQLLTGPLRVRYAADQSKGGAMPGVQYAIALANLRLPPGTIVGVFLAGTTPYFMPQTEFHDFLGKCDTHIAHSPAHWGPPGHNKWDFAYSLGVVRPQYLITSQEYPTANPARTGAQMQQWVSERRDFGFYPSLWRDALFQHNYARTTALVDGKPVQGQGLYVRKMP